MTDLDPYGISQALEVVGQLLTASVVVTVLLFFVKGRG